jgi:hypothetical protein
MVAVFAFSRTPPNTFKSFKVVAPGTRTDAAEERVGDLSVVECSQTYVAFQRVATRARVGLRCSTCPRA